MEFTLSIFMERNRENIPNIPLPNPGEGGPVADLPGNNGNRPVIPLPNPGEGGPVADLPGSNDNRPTIPLPNPGEGGPVADLPGNNGNRPTIPLPNPGEGGPILNWPRRARIRFLNAAFGYPPFLVFVNNRVAVNFLSTASISPYGNFPSGYQTITVSGINGYIYLQKTIPFEAGSSSTVAIINRTGGLDLIQIPDICCGPANGTSNFRVSNLAYNSQPMDVLLGDGRVIYADVQFKETTVYKRIQPGAYQFIFAETHLMPMPSSSDIESLDEAFIGMVPENGIVASLYLNVQRNANYTVFLINNGPETNAIQTMVVEDR